MFKNPFSFNGRITRTEFCVTVLICLLSIPLTAIPSPPLLRLLLLMPFLYLFIAQLIKRGKDLNHPAIYSLLPYHWLAYFFVEGTKGVNKHGKDPKLPEDADENNEKLKAKKEYEAALAEIQEEEEDYV